MLSVVQEMRVAFVYDAAYPWHVGGVEAMNYNEAKELAKDHEVHYFTMRWPGMRSDFSKNGVRYHASIRIDQRRFYRKGKRSTLQALAFSLDLFRIFNYDLDVIITNYFPILHLPVLLLYCKIKRCKLVMQVAEVWDREYWISYLGGFRGAIANAYSSYLLRYADRYIANSSATAGKLRDFGIKDSVISVFSPILDDSIISKVRGTGRSNTIVFSGRFVKEKRIDKWLGVFDAVREKTNAKGLLIGSGPEEFAIREEIKRRGLSKSVTVRGFYHEKMALYRSLKSCAAMMNMSEREGLSIITLESLALGTPVFLPAGSPIPNEVKEMCVVDHDDRLPARIVNCIKSGKKGYIRHPENLEQFRVSRVREFYGRIFKLLWQ